MKNICQISSNLNQNEEGLQEEKHLICKQEKFPLLKNVSLSWKSQTLMSSTRQVTEKQNGNILNESGCRVAEDKAWGQILTFHVVFQPRGRSGPGIRRPKEERKPETIKITSKVLWQSRDFMPSNTFLKGKNRGSPKTKHNKKVSARVFRVSNCGLTAVCSLTSILPPSHKTLQQTTNPLEKER